MSQLTLWAPTSAPDVQVFDPDDDNICAVYSCARSARTSAVRMFVTRDEAMAICCEPETAGKAHQSEWILMWTSISNLRRVLDGGNLALRVEDDGRFAPLLDRLGITPIPLTDPRLAGVVA